MSRFLEAVFVLGWSLIGFATSVTDIQGVVQLLELFSLNGPILHWLKK